MQGAKEIFGLAPAFLVIKGGTDEKNSFVSDCYSYHPPADNNNSCKRGKI